ncbi:hypothetical protein COOONC_23004, partial [Cooperia oncophora]
LAGPTPIVRALLCKPSVSGGVIVIGGCELDVPQSSQASLIPSENSVTKIIEKRVRDYFNNDGDIELEGFILHYSVSLDGPCPLIYACVASPLFGSKNAHTFLNTVKVWTVLIDFWESSAKRFFTIPLPSLYIYYTQ